VLKFQSNQSVRKGEIIMPLAQQPECRYFHFFTYICILAVKCFLYSEFHCTITFSEVLRPKDEFQRYLVFMDYRYSK